MITNLIASIVISLVTNTSERFPQHQVTDPSPVIQTNGLWVSDAVYRFHMENDANPTNKWIMTTITRQSVATFTWDGKPYSVTNEEQLLVTDIPCALQTTWKPVATNAVFWIDKEGRPNQSNGANYITTTNWPPNGR